METRQWDVYLDGKKIESTWWTPGHTSEQIRQSLINHDGFDVNITVKRRKKDAAHRRSGYEPDYEEILREREEAKLSLQRIKDEHPYLPLIHGREK